MFVAVRNARLPFNGGKRGGSVYPVREFAGGFSSTGRGRITASVSPLLTL
jgi:hypothetical protein